MCIFVFSSGIGNSIFRSIRPGRMRAGSKDSILFCGDTASVSSVFIAVSKTYGSHDNFDVMSCVESVQLVEQFEQRSLNFSLASRAGLVSSISY